MNLILEKSDIFGVLASGLCLIHCVSTPLMFMVQTTSFTSSINAPIWWRTLDYLFLLISFFAVYRSAKNTSKTFMKIALWLSWSVLCLLIVNEKIELISLPEVVTYITALTLSGFHIYNLKFCQCKTHTCCTQNG